MDGYYWVDILELAIWCRPFISQNLSLFLISSFNFLISPPRCITANVAPPFIGNISPSHIHDSQALPASCLTQSCPSPGPRHRSSLGSGQLSPATVDHCNGPDTRYNSPAFSAQEPHRCGHCGCFNPITKGGGHIVPPPCGFSHFILIGGV